MRQVRDHTNIIIYVLYLFSFCVCIDTHREKEKEDTFDLWPTERARVQHSAIYSTLKGFFLFTGGEKRKKRCGGEVGRRDDGGELEPGRGMTGEAVRMTAAGRLEVCR